MSVYPTNQNRHFYVVKKCVNGADPATTVDAAIGNIELKTIGVGKDKELYFVYKGANGEIIKSDYIQLKNLDYIKAVDAKDMRIPLKKIRVGLVPELNIADLSTDEDFVLRLTFRQFHGMSDEDIYIKDAAIRIDSTITGATADSDSPYYNNADSSLAETTDTKAKLGNFYRKLAKALRLSLSREPGATANTNPYLDISGDCSGLYIWEKPQPWTLGIGRQERVYFDVMPTTIFYDGTDFEWGVAEDQTLTKAEAKASSNVGFGTTDGNVPRVLPNGRAIADLEWFCLGERGDQYRMVGWPDYIPTYYQINLAEAQEYHVLEIHHAFTDTGVNSYRGEKDITIVAPATTAGKAAINGLVTALRSATGLSSDDLPALT